MKIHFVVIAFLMLMIPRTAPTLPIILIIPFVVMIAHMRLGSYSLDKGTVFLFFALILINFTVIALGPTSPQNFIFAIATHGFIFLFLLKNKSNVPEEHIHYWFKGLFLLAFYEASLGLIQLFSYGFPINLPYRDFTEDFLQGSFGSGGNRFAANIFVLALAVYFYKLKAGEQIDRRPLYLLIFMLIMSSSNMSLAAMILTLIITNTPLLKNQMNDRVAVKKTTTTLSPLQFKKKNLLLGAGVIITVFGFISIGGGYAIDTYNKWTTELNIELNARAMGIKNTFSNLPADAPYQPFVGVGLGGYSSWAQLLLSEDYLRLHILGKHSSANLDWIISQSDIAYDNILIYLSEDYFRAETESIINQPFFSWQSLYGEIGLIGLLLLFLMLRTKIYLIKISPSDNNVRVLFKRVLAFNGVFLLINGFLDNYFEYVWMTVPFLAGLLLLENKPLASGTPNSN